MKSILALAALFALGNLNLNGQSSFELANKHSPFVDAPVYDVYGMPLAGTGYQAELWGAAMPDSLTPLVVIDEGNRREIVPFRTGGYFFSGESKLCVISVNPGSYAWLQVRAWDARLGATYEDVAALGVGGYGESTVFYAQGADPFAVPPESPGPLIGLTSFSLRSVPEPSTWLIGWLGVVGLWWRMRAQRKSDCPK